MTPIELRARREALGLSQADLAAMLDASQPAISAWESGTRAPRDPMSVHLLLCEAEEAFAELLSEVFELIEHSSAVRDSSEVEVLTFRSNEDFWAADARARRQAIPAALHRVAVAHAAFEAREDLAISVRIVERD